jgi:hypothetical protein
MKFLYTICLSLFYYSAFAQLNTNDSTAIDFECVATIFERNINPYLIELAERQITTPADTAVLQAKVSILEKKVKDLRANSYKELIVKDLSKKNKDYFFGYFTLMYRSEFPDLDKNYFDKCRSDINVFRKSSKRHEP